MFLCCLNCQAKKTSDTQEEPEKPVEGTKKGKGKGKQAKKAPDTQPEPETPGEGTTKGKGKSRNRSGILFDETYVSRCNV